MTQFSPALLTDLYELTMAQAYVEQRMTGPAVFSLFVRRLPRRRNYLLACGLDDVLTITAEGIEVRLNIGGTLMPMCS